MMFKSTKNDESNWYNLVDIDVTWMIPVLPKNINETEISSPEKGHSLDDHTSKTIKQYVTSILAKSILTYAKGEKERFDNELIAMLKLAADLSEATFKGDIKAARDSLTNVLRPVLDGQIGKQLNGIDEVHEEQRLNFTPRESAYVKDIPKRRKSRMCNVL